MTDSPKMSRSEMKKLREQLNKEQNPYAKEQAAFEKEYQEEDKKIKKFFRRENKKNKPLKKSRTGEQEKIAARSRFLNKAILGISILLVIVFVAIFYF